MIGGKLNSFQNIVLIVENLKIGGYQRLCLDQAYELSERNIPCRILVLNESSTETNDGLDSMESDLIKRFKIEIIYVTGSRLDQFKKFHKIFSVEKNPSIVISHTLRATVIINLLRKISSCDLKILTTIHQIPLLTDKRQRFKRYIYSQFTDSLFGYSTAVVSLWNAGIEKSFLLKLFCKRKKITLLRNGIYLNRLPVAYEKENKLRVIFLARETFWKGFNRIPELMQKSALVDSRFLLIMPKLASNFEQDFPDNLRERIDLLIGKTIKSLSPSEGDVHIYPTNYGLQDVLIESISLNCLEMACLGIPSFITEGGLSTWPEFVGSPLFIEESWKDLNETSSKILSVSRKGLQIEESIKLRKIINISNQIDDLLTYL